MLAVIKTETQRSELQAIPAVQKLTKLTEWEMLLIQICHSLDDWPKARYDNQMLMNKCKQCLMAIQSGDNIVPRMEIIDHCASMLLNLNEWGSLMQPDKRFPSLELCAVFASAVVESENFKTKKLGRDAWDYVLPMFMLANKRGVNAGGGTGTAPTVASNLLPFLKRLRNVPS